MKITLISVGKTKADATTELLREYEKRLRGSVQLIELSASKNADPATRKTTEAQAIIAAIPLHSAVLVLDERGKNLTSAALANTLQAWQNQGFSQLCVIIGGADGLTDDVRARADLVLALGSLTWPHRLVRVLILEQLYRAFSILSGHPYHRE